MTKVYVLNGYSRNSGQWEVELLASKEKAENRFNNYVDEFQATRSEEDEYFATCDDGVTWMSMEEREIEE